MSGNTTRYYGVNLYIDGKRKYAKIHQLVFETFVEIVPYGMTINHKDTNSLNNKLENLELITCQENIQKSKDFNTDRKYFNPKVKITNLKTNEVKYFLNASETSRYLNVSSSTIRNHLKRIYSGIINEMYQIDIKE